MQAIYFISRDHEAFYTETLTKIKKNDAEHRTLVYLLGSCKETRENADKIYSVENDLVYKKALKARWQTEDSSALTTFAFSLWHGCMEPKLKKRKGARFLSGGAPAGVCLQALALFTPDMNDSEKIYATLKKLQNAKPETEIGNSNES